MKKVSRILSAALAVALAMGLAGCEGLKGSTKDTAQAPVARAATSPMKAGVYTQAAEGMHGPLVVEVTLSERKIEKVEIKSQNETAGLSDLALAELPGRIVAAQSVGIDAVSGSTMTSNAILAAVGKAIEAAGGKVEEFMVKDEPKPAAKADRKSTRLNSSHRL